MNAPRCFAALSGAWLLAVGAAAQTNQITAITPNTAAQGATGVLVSFTLESDAPPPPPAGVAPTSVRIGGISGTAVTHASQYVVTAQFDVPAAEPLGAKDATIVFPLPNPPGGSLTCALAGGFMVTTSNSPPVVTSDPASRTVAPGTKVIFRVAASGSVPLTYQWQKDEANLGLAGDDSAFTIAAAAVADQGSYRCVVSNDFGSDPSAAATLIVDPNLPAEPDSYVVVDTAQAACYGSSGVIAPPVAGAAFHGQDAQYAGVQPDYAVSGDALTVYDRNTGLTWMRSPDRDGNGEIDAADKFTWAAMQAYPASRNAANFGGYDDWRLPTIKELYSLMDFRGTDPSGYPGADTSGLVPYLDPNAFAFGYGDTAAGERLIDAQYGSSTLYASTTGGGDQTLFGVNFADGRIKGYGLTVAGQDKTFYVICCRGNPNYGVNDFADNTNGTVTDRATGLMWQRADSLTGMDWSAALAHAEGLVLANFSDWRLPNAKELHSILEYTRSPATTGSAAIDPVFTCTPITNEAGAADFPFYWTGTTHANWTATPGHWAAYLCFGRAMGYMNSTWIDVHGAGAQRSDPKYDDGTDYSTGHGPQGDCVRITNFVRCVRTVLPTDDSVGDGITDAWRREHFGGTGTTTDANSAATADPDGDGCDNRSEFIAGTDPNDPRSRFSAAGARAATGFVISVASVDGRRYTLRRTTDLVLGSWESVPAQSAVPGTGGVLDLTDLEPPADTCFYRVEVAIP